jgi:hypothetical protein
MIFVASAKRAEHNHKIGSTAIMSQESCDGGVEDTLLLYPLDDNLELRSRRQQKRYTEPETDTDSDEETEYNPDGAALFPTVVDSVIASNRSKIQRFASQSCIDELLFPTIPASAVCAGFQKYNTLSAEEQHLLQQITWAARNSSEDVQKIYRQFDFGLKDANQRVRPTFVSHRSVYYTIELFTHLQVPEGHRYSTAVKNIADKLKRALRARQARERNKPARKTGSRLSHHCKQENSPPPTSYQGHHSLPQLDLLCQLTDTPPQTQFDSLQLSSVQPPVVYSHFVKPDTSTQPRITRAPPVFAIVSTYRRQSTNAYPMAPTHGSLH